MFILLSTSKVPNTKHHKNDTSPHSSLLIELKRITVICTRVIGNLQYWHQGLSYVITKKNPVTKCYPVRFDLTAQVQQERIPVGCVLPAAVAIGGGGAGQFPLNFPLGCPSTWVWAWTKSLSTSPLCVGLDQIPLNFPLGSGPGPDPPQLPPWLWAWTRSPSTSPLVVGLEPALWDQGPPQDQAPPLDQAPPQDQASPLPVDRILDTGFLKYYFAPNFVCGR